ncbi:MAG TPA: oligosaccharide flippase family protein [Candidatus Paceibacterota bacterium]|nr:oligosaccharide flippase family protein [Candidatus Paceibacterota bacterium]
MYTRIQERLYRFLRWSERYTKTDMVYLAESGFWMQANSVFIAIASFGLYLVFARVVPKEVYGTYQYLLSIGTIVASFTLTGMSTAVIRAVARGFEGSFRESIRVQLLWGIIPTIGAWVASAYYLVHGNATLGIGLIVLGIFVPLNTTLNTYGAYLTAKRDFRRSFLYSLFINAPYYLAVISTAFSVSTALALLIANLVSQCLGYVLAHRQTLRTFKPTDIRDPEAIPYGIHLSTMNFLSATIAQLDNILVFHFLGAGPLALYSFATAVPDRLDIFKNVTSAAFPKFANRTHAEIRSSIAHKLFISIGAALVIALVWNVLAHSFFALFFPRYIDAVPYSQVYVFLTAAMFGSFFTTALVAHGHIKLLYAYKIITPLLQIVILIAGIVLGGLWGLVIARVVSALAASLVAMVFFFKAGETL